MNYQIIEKQEIRIVGKSIPLTHVLEDNFAAVPKFWQDSIRDGTVNSLAPLVDSAPFGLLGISRCNEENNWKYYIGVSSSKPADGFEEYVIPAATWAVFKDRGESVKIQELERRVATEWLPSSVYEYANVADIEVYPAPDSDEFEVWIAVVKK